MSNPSFEAVPNAQPHAGLVLRVGSADYRYLRLTHVFSNCVYAMWVSDAAQARYARRPQRLTFMGIQEMAASPDSTWGRLRLPPGFIQPPAHSIEEAALNAGWKLIEPLISAFQKETNLSRNNFTALIRARAEATSTSAINLIRMVKRFYYFGGTRLALLPLPRGTKPGEGGYRAASISDIEAAQPKRRGRQPILADELGRNDFIVSEDDITDMVNCLKSCLRKGATFITDAHEEYLAGPFRRRHPTVYAEYVQEKRLVPVTTRQFRYYVDAHNSISEDLSANLRTHANNRGHLGSIRASGPGEVYEIDATGGRLHLVTAGDSPTEVGKPTIYLIIDRWSRFVVAVYLSLRPPSYEEVRHALLVAFTSREVRFRQLGVDIDDLRWPVGRMPAVLCTDRGAEFLSDAFEQAVVEDLRIELTPLPPLCPDGKAIVERLIREVKRRMANTRMKGVYADRPLDPPTKSVERRARAAAIHSLAQAYRVLIEIIQDHNNRPHTALRRRRILTQAGVRPIPKEAYLWGIENISGIRMAPLSDGDYQRMLLSTDTAGASKGVLRYGGRPYLPLNEMAHGLANSWTRRVKSVGVRLDKTCPNEILIATARREWAIFRIAPGSANDVAGITLQEEEAFASQTARLWARAEHSSRVSRVARKSTGRRALANEKTTVAKVDKQAWRQARESESSELKRKLTGRPPTTPPPTIVESQPAQASWALLEEKERLHNLEVIRKHRSKK